jgi:hypothetical protein
MSENSIFDNKNLIEIRTGRRHDEVHPAWKDDTNEGFLICYSIELLFDDESTFTIQPCEVELQDRFPALGLEVSEGKLQEQSYLIEMVGLPSKILEIEQADYLGEGVENQMEFTLKNDKKVVIRHVFPPMTLGLKIEASNA